jgi:DNA polymerase-3 subunit beta
MRLLKDDGELKIYAAGGKKAVFQYGDTFLSTKLIEGTFPNYRQVIPQNFAERVEVVCGELLAAVRRVAMVSGDDRTIPAKLTFSGNELIVTMQSPDVGEAREVVAVKYGGKELTYSFNPEFVMALLRNLDETAPVYIELSAGHGPATFKCDLPFLYVLMPLLV